VVYALLPGEARPPNNPNVVCERREIAIMEQMKNLMLQMTQAMSLLRASQQGWPVRSRDGEGQPRSGARASGLHRVKRLRGVVATGGRRHVGEGGGSGWTFRAPGSRATYRQTDREPEGSRSHVK